MHGVAKAVGVAALAAVWAGPVQGAALTADAILNQFNLVVFDDMHTQSNMEGRAWIGGNLTGTGEFFTRGGHAILPPSALGALYVGGSVSGGWAKVQNGGDAFVKGSVAQMEIRPGGVAHVEGSIGTIQGGGSVVAGPVTIPNFEAPLTAASAALALHDGGGPTLVHGRHIFDAAPVGGRTVYTVSAAAFSSWNEIELRLGGAETVLINVEGEAATFKANVVNTPLSLAGSILWNFENAQTLGVTRTLLGSVLAPKAHTTLGQVVEGTLVTRSLQMNAQIHLQPWTGNFQPLVTSFAGEPPAAGVVPVPAAAPLLVGALGLLALLRRRRGA